VIVVSPVVGASVIV